MRHLWFIVFLSRLSLVLLSCLIPLDDTNIKSKTQIWEIENHTQTVLTVLYTMPFLPTTITLPHKAYIVLQTEERTEYTIHYITLNKEIKNKMVECVIELRNKLKSQNSLIIVNIVRETYDFLSSEFIKIFPYLKTPILLSLTKRMYKISNKKQKQPILEVLPDVNRLDQLSVFVLETYETVYILRIKTWNDQIGQSEKYLMARYFAIKIANYHDANLNVVQCEMDELTKIEKFTSMLENEDDIDISKLPIINKKNIEKKNVQLVQLKVNQNTNEIQYIFIFPSADSYYTEELDSTGCYLLTISRVNEIFVYIGRDADTELINKTLLYLETIRSYRISFIRENKVHPAFEIMFRKYINEYLGTVMG